MRRTLLVMLAVILLAGLGAPPDVGARGRRYRPPSRKKILRMIKDGEAKIYHLSRSGLKDLSITFKKFTKVGWITRLMYWKAPDRILYKIEGLPEDYQKVQKAFVGKMIEEFDGTMYPFVCMPWSEYVEEFDLSVPDPEEPKAILLVPKKDRRARFLRKLLELDDSGLPVRVTTFWSPAPPTKEELEIDPNFKGRERESLTELTYLRIGRKFFFRRVDMEVEKGRKVIVDIEKWQKHGEYWIPTELTLVDPFAGNEVLKPEGIRLNTGLADEMFEGSGFRLER